MAHSVVSAVRLSFFRFSHVGDIVEDGAKIAEVRWVYSVANRQNQNGKLVK